MKKYRFLRNERYFTENIRQSVISTNTQSSVTLVNELELFDQCGLSWFRPKSIAFVFLFDFERMKLLSTFLVGSQAAGVYVDKNEASEFLQRKGRANTGMLTEEFRTGKLQNG